MRVALPTHAGRVAVVTGAGQGIGQATARQLAERGALVVAVDLADCSETAALLGRLSLGFIVVRADVSTADGWELVQAETVSAFGRTDIVVNNAGIYPSCDIQAMTYEEWSRVIRVNLDSVFYAAKIFVQIMARSNWGRIVNITTSSIAANNPGQSHYIASKMGVIGFTRGLANDVAPLGITVNAVGPALTRTPGASQYPQELFDYVVARQAIRKIAEPDDIVGPILFLTSEDAHFVTGHTIMADGGMCKL